MGKNSKIEWCDDSFSPWIGCSHVSAGCANCYAEKWDKTYTGGKRWDGTTTVRPDAAWNEVLSWNRQAGKSGINRRVFCAHYADWCDENAPTGQFERLWDTIRKTPNLDWQLLTKRHQRLKLSLPADWGSGYPNVWLGVTVENRKQGLPRIDVLREIPAKVRFLSCEPLLENLGTLDLTGIHWVIVGGEKAPNFRPMDLNWARSIRDQCLSSGVPFFFKQTGGRSKGLLTLDGVEYTQYPDNCPGIGTTKQS